MMSLMVPVDSSTILILGGADKQGNQSDGVLFDVETKRNYGTVNAFDDFVAKGNQYFLNEEGQIVALVSDAS